MTQQEQDAILANYKGQIGLGTLVPYSAVVLAVAAERKRISDDTLAIMAAILYNRLNEYQTSLRSAVVTARDLRNELCKQLEQEQQNQKGKGK